MKKRLIIITIFIMLFLAGITFGFYQTEFQKKPIVQEKMQSKDYDYLYNFYFTSEPNIIGRPFYGDAKASIVIIAYMDITSDSTKYFIENIYPVIKTEYLDTGKAKFYQKNYAIINDLQDNSNEFQILKSLNCMIEAKQDNRYFFDLVKSDVKTILEKYNISTNKDLMKIYDACMTNIPDNLLEDISEVENFGIVGINPRFYIGFNSNDKTVLDGIPSLRVFTRTLKNYQVQIGD